MKRLFNLPTLVIVGLLSIYYLAIFFNLRHLLLFVSGNLPTLFLFFCLLILPVGLKGGMVVFKKNRYAIRILLLFSGIIALSLIVLALTKTDLHSVISHSLKVGFFKQFHGLVIGLIIFMVVYLLYFLVVTNLDLENFIASIKALPLISPVFCFGAPAFWKKSLQLFHLHDNDIFLLSLISFLAGIIFLLGILIFYVGKNYKPGRITNTFAIDDAEVTNTDARQPFFKFSLGMVALGIAMLLYVCVDIAYLILVATI